jgi:peptidase E
MPNNQKLFLASAFEKVVSQFTQTFDLKPNQNKVAFIQNAALPEGNPEEMFWVIGDKQAFFKEGYLVEAVDFTKFESEKALKQKLLDFEIIHFCGGNTLYLNYLTHQTGLNQILTELVASGDLIYTGSSAGSIITSPNLYAMKDSLLENIDPKFLAGIQESDYQGLNLVPFLIMPHANKNAFLQANLKAVEKLPIYPHPLLFLRDSQAVVVNGNNFQIIQS